MKNRAQEGSTLSLVIVCAIIIAMVGIGFIFLSNLFGGNMEGGHATDSGCLNVASKALLAPGLPSTALTSGVNADVGLAMVANLIPLSNSGGSNYPQNMGLGTGAPGDVNLLTYNRFVATAMLVALNADAEGAGSADAATAVKFVEGAGGLGSQLQSSLGASGANNWASSYYNAVTGNVLTMVGSYQAPTFQDSVAGNMLTLPTDNHACNINMSAFQQGSAAYNAVKTAAGVSPLPITDYSNPTTALDSLPGSAFTSGPNAGDTNAYLNGYTAIGLAGTQVVGLPNLPGQQPHLVSTTQFASENANPLSVPGAASVVLPPNAFKITTSTGQLNNAPGQGTMNFSSASMVGTPLTAFPLAMPGGYMTIDNSGTQKPLSFTMPNTDNVAAHELGTGILVDKTTSDFAYGPAPNGGPNLVDQWEQFPHTAGNATYTPPTTGAPANPPQTPPIGQWNGSSYTGLYNSQGQPMMAQGESQPSQAELNAAANIPFNGSSILCTDNNTSAPNGDSTCQNLASNSVPPKNLDSFDQAYHPNTSTTGNSQSVNTATAAELSQCETLSLYGASPHGGGPPEAFNYTFGPTGVRCYPTGIPSDTNQYAWQGPPGTGGFNMVPDADGGAGVTVTDSGFTPQSNGGGSGVANTVLANTTDGDGTGTCQVTQKGTVLDYFNQIAQMSNFATTVNGSPVGAAGASPAAVKAFLDQRMLEVYPQATQANMDAITGPVPNSNQTAPSSSGFAIDAGRKYYIYFSTSSPYASPAGSAGLTISTTPPSYVSQLQTAHQSADGKTHQASGTYPCLQGLANPFFCYGIHDRLFTTWGTNSAGDDNMGEITAYQTASFQPGSGAFGNLGDIKFSEYVMPGNPAAGYTGGPPPGFPGTGTVPIPTFNNRD